MGSAFRRRPNLRIVQHKMKGFVFLLAVALALPLATAFNCNELNLEDRELCNSIQQSSLSSIEKDLLIDPQKAQERLGQLRGPEVEFIKLQIRNL